MTSAQSLQALNPDLRFRYITFLSITLGALLYAAIVFGVLVHQDFMHFGWSIYDEAFLALKDGHHDLPVRVLRIEGHLTPNGEAYLYHGLAPLLTRLVLSPFVDFTTTPLGPFSIWFWTTLGTSLYHIAFFSVARDSWPATGRNKAIWSVLLAGTLWVGGPGLILVSNLSLYHEPIAVAYAISAAIIFLWTYAVRKDIPIRKIVIYLAILAAFSVHARPNLAVGLYCIVATAALYAFWLDPRKALIPALASGLILAAGGGTYLGYNALRFGESLTVHGSFVEGPIQYAIPYWGLENPDSGRVETFTEHGRFNPGRILPNASYYLFEPPEVTLSGAQQGAKALYYAITSNSNGFVRIEGPGAGLFFLWPIWVIFAFVGIREIFQRSRSWTIPVVGMGVSALLTWSYATITLRYHIDIIPLIGVLAIVGLYRMTPIIATLNLGSSGAIGLVFAGLFGLMVNTTTAAAYRYIFLEIPGQASGPWSEETCNILAQRKGFTTDRIDEICRPPRTQYD